MALTYPYTLAAGTDADAAEVQGNFDAVKTLVDTLGTGAADTTWRTIAFTGLTGIDNTRAIDTVFHWAVGLTNGIVVTNTSQLGTVYLDDADYTLSGGTPKLRVRGLVWTNATDPGTTLVTMGLHAITAVAGGAGANTPTITATPVTDSTATFPNLAASTAYTQVSSEFSVPADGFYALGIKHTVAIATNAQMAIGAHLQVKVAA